MHTTSWGRKLIPVDKDKMLSGSPDTRRPSVKINVHYNTEKLVLIKLPVETQDVICVVLASMALDYWTVIKPDVVNTRQTYEKKKFIS